MKINNIFVGADHAGFEFKNKLIQAFPKLPWKDLGTNSSDSVDYPDFADAVSKSIKSETDYGVLICGSGQGMSIRANKYKNIRAALCWSEEIAKLSRAHNNANILCLGSRAISIDLAIQILKVFFETQFEGGRHAQRIEKLSR